MAASAATLVFLLSLICVPSRFLTGALPPPPPTVAKPLTPPPATPSKPALPPPATAPPKPVTPPPATPSKPVLPPPATPPKLVLPRPATPPKPMSPPPATPAKPVLSPPATPPKLVLPPTKAPPKPVLPPTKAPLKPVLPPPPTLTKPVLPPPPATTAPPKPATPPRAWALMPALSPALAPAPWDEPGYQSKPVPEPVRKACVRTPFPDLCGRVLAFTVDPQRANDTRRLAEASTHAAIDAGTALAAFGYVHIGGAKNGTRLRICVRDCTVRIDAAVKNLTASAAAMKRGERAEAAKLLGEAAKGVGVCWGSCARFTGEAMVVMIKRARQFERLVMIASAIILMIV